MLFWLQLLGGQGGGRLCLVDWFLFGLLLVQVLLDWRALIFDTLAVILLSPSFVNSGSFSVLCLFLCLLAVCLLLFFPFTFVDPWKVGFDDSVIDVHGILFII